MGIPCKLKLQGIQAVKKTMLRSAEIEPRGERKGKRRIPYGYADRSIHGILHRCAVQDDSVVFRFFSHPSVWTKSGGLF